MKIEIIADDFTGANDIGIQLRKYGLKVVSIIENNENIESDVKIISSETRNEKEDVAYEKVKKLFADIKKSGYDKFYKKIDSTLRGSIKAEIEAVKEQLNIEDKIVVVVGFPKTNRKILDGKHYIGEVELHKTEFRNDPIHPIKENDLIKLIGGRLVTLSEIRGDLKRTLKQIKDQVLVFDTENELDLAKIALALVELKLDRHSIGSSGIMEYLMKYWGYKKERVLIVAGSCNEINIKQVENFIKENRSELDIVEIDPFSEKNVNIENLNKDILIRSIREKEEMYQILERYNSGEVSDYIAEIVKRVIEKENIKNIIICGGETSLKVLKQIGVEYLDIKREVDTGIALGYFDKYKIITKPGGFGKENFYKIAYEELKNADTIK